MLTVGTSTFVYPAAGFPLETLRNGGTLIEVNLYESEPTPLCGVSLHGKAGEVLPGLISNNGKLRKDIGIAGFAK
jgi:NAD-dependent deacetylase